MISLIVAHDRNRLIGSNGMMPWGHSFRTDLNWFKQFTSNHIVVMGSKTFDSIGKPLSNRINVVLTRDDAKTDYLRESLCYVIHSVDEVLSEWVLPDKETFIIGGSEVYKQLLPYADRLYITHIDSEFEGDTHFPKYNLDEYKMVYGDSVIENGCALHFRIYDRIKTKK